jgi:hypothetical protein
VGQLPEPPQRQPRGVYREALEKVLADKQGRPALIATFDSAQGATRTRTRLKKDAAGGKLPVGTKGGEWEFVAINTSYTDDQGVDWECSELHAQYHAL